MKNAIYPCLWFNGNAKDAANFYLEIFEDIKIVSENPFVIMMEIIGNKLMLLNGGPEFSFNEAVSLVIPCETQKEIDYYWSKLTYNGKEGKCGWLTDQFGLSWQVVPNALGKWMSNAETAPKVMYAFMQMTKFEIDKLEAAANN